MSKMDVLTGWLLARNADPAPRAGDRNYGATTMGTDFALGTGVQWSRCSIETCSFGLDEAAFSAWGITHVDRSRIEPAT